MVAAMEHDRAKYSSFGFAEMAVFWDWTGERFFVMKFLGLLCVERCCFPRPLKTFLSPCVQVSSRKTRSSGTTAVAVPALWRQISALPSKLQRHWHTRRAAPRRRRKHLALP